MLPSTLAARGWTTYQRLAIATLGGTVFVILWGAFVRATGSGAGCGSHWPMCNGEVIPRAPSAATLVELTHRLTSGLLGFLTLALIVSAFRTFTRGHPARRASATAGFFLITEALIGAGLVLLELVADNRSLARGWWMAAHLVNTFLLLMWVSIATWHGWHDQRLRLRGGDAARFAGALVLLLAVGVSGAIAALGDTLFPATSLAAGLAQDLSPGAHVLLRLRVIHPFLASFAAAAMLWLTGTLVQRGPTPLAKRIAGWTARVVLLQIVIGFANLALLAPTALQLVHLLLADAIWVGTVLLAAATLSAPQVAPAIDVTGARAPQPR
jgi:cytochrome c oxidase assembly protein subunit 15